MRLVSIISSMKGGGAELLVRELHKIYTNCNLVAHTVYLNGTTAGLKKSETTLGVNPRSPLNIFRIRKLLKYLSSNVQDKLTVHVHLSWPLLYVTLASLGLPNIKLVYTEHNTTNKRRRIPLFWIFERLLYARYSRIICISQGVNDALAKWVGPKIAQRLVTIPNGSRIYSLVDRPILVGRLPRLVSVGSLSSRKNFSTAIRAIAQIRDQVASYEIVGEGPERKKLEQLIHREKLDDKVKLLGWSDNIEAHLQTADIQLIPSLWEGFGLVAVEGMSTGLSVVASDVAGLREVLDSNNLAVTLVEDLKSADAWVYGLKVAIDNWRNEDPEKMSGAARTQAEKFTLETMAERYLEVYRSLL
jgi:glycosyltransferase involved in cell wall biosynthesis